MRSLIILALFALAICDQPTDALVGFSTQLAFTEAQTEALNNCVVTLAQETEGLAPLYSDAEHGKLQSLITDGESLFENAEPAIQQGCGPLLQTLQSYEVTFGNGVDPKVNLKINEPYVAQQFAVLIRNVAQENYTGIGATIAYIYQISIGSVDLPSLTPKQLTYEDIIKLRDNAEALEANKDGALEEYFQGYVEELGLSQIVNASALAELVLAFEKVGLLLNTYEASLRNGTFDSDIVALEELITNVLELVRANEQGLNAVAAIDGPVIKAFLYNPLRFVETAIYNALLNAPQLEQTNESIQQDLIAGDFAGAGSEAGSLVTTVYGPIYTN